MTGPIIPIPIPIPIHHDPNPWLLGYQTSQFGTGEDPPPDGGTGAYPYPSVYAALAHPPTEMTTAIELPFPPPPEE